MVLYSLLHLFRRLRASPGSLPSCTSALLPVFLPSFLVSLLAAFFASLLAPLCAATGTHVVVHPMHTGRIMILYIRSTDDECTHGNVLHGCRTMPATSNKSNAAPLLSAVPQF